MYGGGSLTEEEAEAERAARKQAQAERPDNEGSYGE